MRNDFFHGTLFVHFKILLQFSKQRLLVNFVESGTEFSDLCSTKLLSIENHYLPQLHTMLTAASKVRAAQFFIEIYRINLEHLEVLNVAVKVSKLLWRKFRII